MGSVVKVIMESSTGDREVVIDAAVGDALVDLVDDHSGPIPFSCRSAACGTCRIHILEGADQLAPAAQDEIELLDVYDHVPPLVRLTCQAKLGPGATRVRVKAFHKE